MKFNHHGNPQLDDWPRFDGNGMPLFLASKEVPSRSEAELAATQADLIVHRGALAEIHRALDAKSPVLGELNREVEAKEKALAELKIEEKRRRDDIAALDAPQAVAVARVRIDAAKLEADAAAHARKMVAEVAQVKG